MMNRPTMQRLVSALVLFTSLGCKAVSCHDPGMAYGFDNVSLGLCRTLRLSSFLTSYLD